ncbi:hypothetical protein ACF07S_32225 [Streptomyces sp. NPDC016640]|uniref:effector-associated constant component EACC1 n=1 Tax=Streptomyces sp. NPDC016640 TaxID=3364969 RepID=UPI0036FC05D9
MHVTEHASSRELRLWASGSASDDDLRALHAWLAHEDELRGRVELRAHSPAEGDMGGAVELLAVALGSGGACAVLAQSVCTWLSQRQPDITVTVKAADGREVTIDVRRAEDPMAVVREVERLIGSTRADDR